MSTILILTGWLGVIVYALIYIASSAKGRHFRNLVKEYENLPKFYKGRELVDKCYEKFVHFMLDTELSYNEKIYLIELNESIVSKVFENQLERCSFYVNCVSACVDNLNSWFEHRRDYSKFRSSELMQAYSGSEVITEKPLSFYLSWIMLFSKYLNNNSRGTIKGPENFREHNIPDWV